MYVPLFMHAVMVNFHNYTYVCMYEYIQQMYTYQTGFSAWGGTINFMYICTYSYT